MGVFKYRSALDVGDWLAGAPSASPLGKRRRYALHKGPDAPLDTYQGGKNQSVGNRITIYRLFSPLNCIPEIRYGIPSFSLRLI